MQPSGQVGQAVGRFGRRLGLDHAIQRIDYSIGRIPPDFGFDAGGQWNEEMLAHSATHRQPQLNMLDDSQMQIGCWFRWQIGFSDRQYRSWSSPAARAPAKPTACKARDAMMTAIRWRIILNKDSDKVLLSKVKCTGLMSTVAQFR